MPRPEVLTDHRARVGVLLFSGVAFALWTAASAARWANFDYRTFDLAYYVQAVWQLIHGRLEVSVLGAPLLGNHVEPIVFLFAPLFYVFQHPLVFVVVQNALLAAMAPFGYDIARRLGLTAGASVAAAAALLVTPATGYIALHEFHPEALTAPLLLLMLRSRLRDSLCAHWIWFVAVLACKENMALLLAAYCGVHLLFERRRGLSFLARWYGWPLAVALGWFLLCTQVITPAFNSGNIDYVALYDRLGGSPGEIIRNLFFQPQLALSAVWRALTSGNLVSALLLPFLGLPLLRPKWLLIATPILLQHLLSWRSSEWMIYFHYAAPVLPLFWFAAAEAVARYHAVVATRIAAALLLACGAAQAWLGPAGEIVETSSRWTEDSAKRRRGQAFLRRIPASASVTAPLPYLSHLAEREHLYSLHYILKGLKTLSRATYEPPAATDYVFVDYNDSATFDAASGYYHPTMKTADARVIPSSDRLLHEFLRTDKWEQTAADELTLLRRSDSRRHGEPASHSDEPAGSRIGDAELISATVQTGAAIEVVTRWKFPAERRVFPWLTVRVSAVRGSAAAFVVTRGLCAPEATEGGIEERWALTIPPSLRPGEYLIEGIFTDQAQRIWALTHGAPDRATGVLAAPVSLGSFHVPARHGSDPE
jgi:uncharacterized membrane protein